jgi:hypothetical protein
MSHTVAQFESRLSESRFFYPQIGTAVICSFRHTQLAATDTKQQKWMYTTKHYPPFLVEHYRQYSYSVKCVLITNFWPFVT